MNNDTKIKLTTWYPGHIKPLREGAYQVFTESGRLGYQRWDGRYWFNWSSDIGTANLSTERAHDMYQNNDWRGLAKEPKP